MSNPLALPVAITIVRNIIGNAPIPDATFQPGDNPLNPNPASIGTIKTTTTDITTIVADAVIEENHDDDSVLTEQPVEVGSVITDHKFDLPQNLELVYGWSLGSPNNTGLDASFLKTLYDLLLQMKTTGLLCTVNTGKRLYTNMVIKQLIERTDKDNENSMTLRIVMRQIIFVKSQTTTISDASVQQLPQQTGPVVEQGTLTLQPGSNFNPSGGPAPVNIEAAPTPP